MDRYGLAEQFEASRAHMTAVAYRMLGSQMEADDAVQEAWLRLSRSDAAAIDNLSGWLTTVVARVCLDMLRSRDSRQEAPLSPDLAFPSPEPDPSDQALMAESVGLALLVVLETLGPADWRAGPGGGCRGPRRRRGRPGARWCAPFWLPRRAATSRRCWRCLTPRWCCARTKPRQPLAR